MTLLQTVVLIKRLSQLTAHEAEKELEGERRGVRRRRGGRSRARGVRGGQVSCCLPLSGPIRRLKSTRSIAHCLKSPRFQTWRKVKKRSCVLLPGGEGVQTHGKLHAGQNHSEKNQTLRRP